MCFDKLRMKTKIEGTIKSLTDSGTSIENKFNTGVVNGFGKEPCSQPTLHDL